jgi:hypothetical protein
MLLSNDALYSPQSSHVRRYIDIDTCIGVLLGLHKEFAFGVRKFCLLFVRPVRKITISGCNCVMSGWMAGKVAG